MRCFVSIDMPEEVKKKIKQIQEGLPEFRGKKTEEDNLHLTLKFLGEISEDKVEEIKKRLEQIDFKNLNLEIDSIGVFSPSYIRIVWLGIKGAEELQNKIDGSLDGLFKKEKRFMGHLTIARVKGVKDKRKFLEELNKMKIEKAQFDCDCFRFKQSILNEAGPIYKILSEYRKNIN